jgi:tRNA(Arg) A34 adenosine deaminase TadA
MAVRDFDSFDHESHMKRAFELAREAAERGDRPFGSVLVRDDDIVMEDSNRVVTENDIRRHPELHLAYRAARGFDPETRAELVMYTSTEPCSMCASGIQTAGLGRVAFSVSGEELAEIRGGEAGVSSTAILGAETDVVAGVLNDAGRQIHREYYGSE